MKVYHAGIDVGSTTVKMVLLDDQGKTLYQSYDRHYSDVRKTVVDLVHKVYDHNIETLKDRPLTLAMTGSGGMSIAEKMDIVFVQEVIASSKAVEDRIPRTDVAIELGGEDAKITYFGHNMEQRMNGSCAGGTGAFIDQMASLLKTDVQGLNELSKEASQIYAIASRCGVFAKTDIQPLLNEGAAREDIARSIFQAVVNQTISGLACGRPIRGNVAFLGGPLHFLSQLRERFIKTLDLKEEEIIFPKDAHYFVALGAALSARKEKPIYFKDLVDKSDQILEEDEQTTSTLEPLFTSPEDYQAFKERHDQAKVKRVRPEEAEGLCYLGIDAGSTTSKIALIDDLGQLVYSSYGSNQGRPLAYTVEAIKTMLSGLPSNIKIAKSAVTGYGEGLIQAALGVDIGEIETIAHQKAASFFLKETDFVLDIGGQDMKCMMIHDQVIESIKLNEACSSGCGSFIETFAKSMNMDAKSFGQEGIKSRRPVDLGTRCTVFMNSKIKQVQKEGACLPDISAGISYSVIKNALYKVIKLRSPEEFGDKIVVQGGTFYNDSVLRAFEIISGRQAVRPDIAGIMGAFGAALLAKERMIKGQKSSLLSRQELENFTFETSMRRCGLCGNNCLLTVNEFPGGTSHITGNRCERGAGKEKKDKTLPNLYAYKYKRVFHYPSLSPDKAYRGSVGLPRVLNMYEHYPFWHTFFTQLGFRVVRSRRSSKEVYEMGMESIPSESLCYPAKLANGHVQDLLDKKVDIIFYPSIPYEEKEDEGADNQYSCPIVTSYPEVIVNNMDAINREDDWFHHPFLPMHDPDKMAERLYEHFLPYYQIGKKEMTAATKKAYQALADYRADVREKGEEAIRYLEEAGLDGIILAGRPYHIDPEISHGIPEMINTLGVGVLSEDSVAHLSRVDRPLRVVDQWVYHSRLYNAAAFCQTKKNLQMVQLNSFGCGLDAVTSDQVQEILESYGKIYSSIKIDEISNLGAARIRIRSLIAAMKAHKKEGRPLRKMRPDRSYPRFTKEMKKTYTLLFPEMSPIHFGFLESALRASGYQAKHLAKVTPHTVDVGLKYVNNDACYPSILVTGQIMEALLSGDYDLDKTAVMISQTGGGCRATNYIAFIRKALFDANLSKVPVVPLNASANLEKSGFKISLGMVHRMVMGIVYGDLLMRVANRIRPYELNEGETDRVIEDFRQKMNTDLLKADFSTFNKNIRALVDYFDKVPISDEKKAKVGVVGEILVKFHPFANNELVSAIEAEGAEAVVPDLLDFFHYSLHGGIYNYEALAGKRRSKNVAVMGLALMDLYRRSVRRALEKSSRFHPPSRLKELAQGAEKILSLGNRTGEGWFLTAEMVELLEDGVDNIVCIQPFACLPNHVTGKGMIKELRRRYPQANIAPIDYDPGASQVNQINRLKLMLAVARKNI